MTSRPDGARERAFFICGQKAGGDRVMDGGGLICSAALGGVETDQRTRSTEHLSPCPTPRSHHAIKPEHITDLTPTPASSLSHNTPTSH